MTNRQTPAHATHWSTRTLAQVTAVSPSTVGRIWRAHGLKPHRVKTFKLSNDRQFAEKLEDVVSLYRHPPDNAIIDRKSTRLSSNHLVISYAVFCLKKKKKKNTQHTKHNHSHHCTKIRQLCRVV